MGDLDVHGDLLDVFDLVRIVRHVAWDDPLPFERQLAAVGIGSRDAERAAAILGRASAGVDASRRMIASLDRDGREARLRFRDGSSITIPRVWNGRISDLTFDGELAPALMRSPVSLAAIARPSGPASLPGDLACGLYWQVEVNRVFYREQPHQMRRYSALAFDNIRRDPLAFARASAYRAVRLFIIQGTEDRHTAQQFSRSRVVYTVATVVSASYFLLFAAGVVIAWRRRCAMLLPIALIAYVPLTISAVLTNMRYSITIQPLIFMFIAVALIAALERLSWLPARAAAGRDPAGT